MAPSALISGTSHPKITFVTPSAKKIYLPPNVPGRVLKRRPSESSWEHLCRKSPLHAYDSEIRVHAENSVICVLVRKPRIWIKRLCSWCVHGGEDCDIYHANVQFSVELPQCGILGRIASFLHYDPLLRYWNRKYPISGENWLSNMYQGKMENVEPETHFKIQY